MRFEGACKYSRYVSLPSRKGRRRRRKHKSERHVPSDRPTDRPPFRFSSYKINSSADFPLPNASCQVLRAMGGLVLSCSLYSCSFVLKQPAGNFCLSFQINEGEGDREREHFRSVAPLRSSDVGARVSQTHHADLTAKYFPSQATVNGQREDKRSEGKTPRNEKGKERKSVDCHGARRAEIWRIFSGGQNAHHFSFAQNQDFSSYDEDTFLRLKLCCDRLNENVRKSDIAA